MEEQFSYHPKGNLLLSFSTFSEWTGFCRLCVQRDIPITKDADLMSAIISPEDFQRLPKDLRDDFKIQNAETTKKLLAKRRGPIRIKRADTRISNQQPIDEQKIIDRLLPAALMPRVK